jgi:hypothetical protein
MVNIHVKKVIDDILKHVEDIFKLDKKDNKYAEKVSYLNYLIESLRSMDDPVGYYNLIILGSKFARIEGVEYNVGDSYEYAVKYINKVDEPNPEEFGLLSLEDKTMLSIVYMTIATFIDAGKKDYYGVSADDLYATSFILLPSSEVLKKIIYRYFSGKSSVPAFLIKKLLVDAKSIGLYEAHVYDILISHSDSQLDTKDAFNEFYNQINSSEKATDIMRYIEGFMLSNLKELENKYQDTEDLYQTLIPVYCFVFVLGSDLIVGQLDKMLVQYPQYSQLLKDILSQEDLLRYVDLAKKYRLENKKEPN